MVHACRVLLRNSKQLGEVLGGGDVSQGRVTPVMSRIRSVNTGAIDSMASPIAVTHKNRTYR